MVETRQPTDIAPTVLSKLPIRILREPAQVFQYPHARRVGNQLYALMYLQVTYVPLLLVFTIVVHRVCEREFRWCWRERPWRVRQGSLGRCR